MIREYPKIIFGTGHNDFAARFIYLERSLRNNLVRKDRWRATS